MLDTCELEYQKFLFVGPVGVINIIHFACIMSLCYKNLCSHVRQYIALLFYIITWSEQKCIAGNAMKNGKVYCLMSVCNCFVIILQVHIF